LNLHNVQFIRSAAGEKDFIRDGLPQIVFAGRSNVGKSSVINKLLNRNNLARSSATPGKTAHINYFLVDETLYLVDLPGYGYAKVSETEKQRWGILMERYFSNPELISAGVLIVDARHKPTTDDQVMAGWFQQTGCPLLVLANKTDKVKKSELSQKLDDIKRTLSLGEDALPIPFSAEKGTGREEVISRLNAFVTEPSIQRDGRDTCNNENHHSKP
jgi:GTP-binding protein